LKKLQIRFDLLLKSIIVLVILCFQDPKIKNNLVFEFIRTSRVRTMCRHN